MRVSTSQIYNLGLDSMQKHSVEAMNFQTQISSGNKYQHASDSGLAAGLGVQVQLNKAQFDMFKVNQDHLSATYASSETQIQSINNMLLRAQQLMVPAGNDAIGAQGRSAKHFDSIKQYKWPAKSYINDVVPNPWYQEFKTKTASTTRYNGIDRFEPNPVAIMEDGSVLMHHDQQQVQQFVDRYLLI